MTRFNKLMCVCNHVADYVECSMLFFRLQNIYKLNENLSTTNELMDVLTLSPTCVQNLLVVSRGLDRTRIFDLPGHSG